ncbi:MAG TPA: anthranilate synthase component I family protein, partial [Nitrospiria bacterium]|nr:anthranilate synthase component I family protein [Nitrospiria bacterium]
GSNSFLLESVGGTSRYSFIGVNPDFVFRSKGTSIEIEGAFGKTAFQANPVEMLKKLLFSRMATRHHRLPPFFGGAVGLFGFDLVKFYERLPQHAMDDLDLPDLCFLFVNSVIAFDHEQKTIQILYTPTAEEFFGLERENLYRHVVTKIKDLQERLLNETSMLQISSMHAVALSDRPRSLTTREEYLGMVQRCKDYIAAGDIFQANLSHRFSIPIGQTPPLCLYKALRRINPSPFSAYLDFGSFQIVSSSPERLVKLEGREVQTRPIAGTRPRGRSPLEDRQFAEELILNEKERAEHLMLVDLERNDLGRVCEYGTVRVDELMTIEFYSHVMHIVSNIRGRMRPDRDCFDLLKAVFPGGTITGVPKVRCLEIIEELEPVKRGAAYGSIGYINFAGDMDLNILIRTMIVKNKEAYFHVGAGIVADSQLEKEYEETLHKAQALFLALQEAKADGHLY